MFMAMKKAKEVIKKVGREYGEKYGRAYDLTESYRLDDAETAIVCLGSTAGTAKDLVDDLRNKGQKAGLLKIRVFRPFPFEDICAALGKLKAVAVLDRSDSLNSFGGPVFSETAAALYSCGSKVKLINYVYGLGGRDIDMHMLSSVYDRLEKIKNGGEIGELVSYLGVRV
jgi:pyruvate ferredoxin oxidoreductase alpha subunit